MKINDSEGSTPNASQPETKDDHLKDDAEKQAEFIKLLAQIYVYHVLYMLRKDF